MERYLCIHGHFYQPPRENPRTGEVEREPSAAPHHDWNERITAECYGPNAANLSRSSFNFGPTLLSWMERKAPDAYRAVLQADRLSQDRFSGSGSAIAQVYNHVILPLANHRDRVTQVVWGIRDFEKRFRRRPGGIWLAETAVDLETLEILADQGIRFTILAPHQARRVRTEGTLVWRETDGGRLLDTTHPYRSHLRSGRSIDLFFYDAALSRAISFEHLLDNGDRFGRRLIDSPAGPGGLIHVASDGENYGHHHPGGDRALARALDLVESSGSARLTNYAESLRRDPPVHQVEIAQKSSWSCVHGIDRWWSDCGCNSGGHPGWSQAWRTPLRDALDWLRDEIAGSYESKGGRFFADPWAARDGFIDLILDRSPESVERFFAAHAAGPLGPEERASALKLLEMQRHALLMYTSCGWFFDDLSGIETVLVIRQAARAIELAGELFGGSLEEGFLARLGMARSNLPEMGSGRQVYERFAKT